MDFLSRKAPGKHGGFFNGEDKKIIGKIISSKETFR
jgi:hypothetical protein